MVAMLLCAMDAAAQYKDANYASLEDSDVVSSMKQQVAYLSSASLGGRKAGSDGEKEAAMYISGVLSSYGLDVLSGSEGEIFGMKQDEGDTLISRNVIAYIPGYDSKLKDHYIVIGARMDNLGTVEVNVDGEMQTKVFYGANGNASGVSMLMQLARMLGTNSVLLKRSVIIAAFGSGQNGCAGSWYFLNRSFKGVKEIDAMIDLDILGTASGGFYAYTASNKDLNDDIEALASSLQPIQPRLVSLEPVYSDHRMFYDKEIPAVMFTTGMYPEYNSDRDVASILEYESMERELEYIYNFTMKLVNGTKPEFRTVDETKKKYVSDKDVYPYYECDTKPIFLGSDDPGVFLKKWVYVYLKYPRTAVEEGVQGRVLVDFIIDEKGKVTDVKVVKGVDARLDEEAVRVIEASPDWKPARILGKKVKSEMSLYVEFRLQKKK